MANELHIGGGGSITDAELVSAITDELVAAGFSQGGGGGVKEYVAILTQTGTNAPTATVLYNSYDDAPTYSYVSEGVYAISSPNSEFKDGKTIVMPTIIDSSTTCIVELFYIDPSEIRIVTSSWDITDAATPPISQDTILSGSTSGSSAKSNFIWFKTYP